MRKIEGTARPDWRATAEAAGFSFHEMHGEPYWDEESAYSFTLEEVETRIEDPSTALHAMVREAVGRVAESEALMAQLGIPEGHMDAVAGSWREGEMELYGRFDLSYGGEGPAKLLEYNADTPTALFETASFQWDWLVAAREAGLVPAGADQLNGLFEALADRFRWLFAPGEDIHFTAHEGSAEDYATVETMAYAAREAGMGAHYVDLAKLAFDADGRLLDDEARVIGTLFKLYPWEDLLRDDEAAAILASETRFLEPAWKAIASNKGLLPVLWEMFEGHPNLLASFFAADLERDDAAFERARAAGAFGRGRVTKPIFSREGASVDILGPAGEVIVRAENRPYDAHPRIVQDYAPLPDFGGFRPVLGTWIVGETCVALGMREDRSEITGDLSRFKPHYIEP